MCHDGANPVPLLVDVEHHEAEGDDEWIDTEAQENSRRIKFRAMICVLIQKGYNVALVNGLDWHDTKVRISRADRSLC